MARPSHISQILLDPRQMHILRLFASGITMITRVHVHSFSYSSYIAPLLPSLIFQTFPPRLRDGAASHHSFRYAFESHLSVVTERLENQVCHLNTSI